jgi:hypothetical protein
MTEDRRATSRVGWENLRVTVLSEEPVCRVCGEARSTQVDHIVPRFMGGLDERTNLQGLCVPCHEAKSAREQAREWSSTVNDRDLATRQIWRSACMVLERAGQQCQRLTAGERCTQPALYVYLRPLRASVQTAMLDACRQGRLEQVMRLRSHAKGWTVRCPAHRPRSVPFVWSIVPIILDALTINWQSWELDRAVWDAQPWPRALGYIPLEVQRGIQLQLRPALPYLVASGKAEGAPKSKPGNQPRTPNRWRLPRK